MKGGKFMEIIEFNAINSLDAENNTVTQLNYGCNNDCWSDDDSCPSFCDHEWGT